MKKLFAILLCIAMMLSMVACGGNEDDKKDHDNKKEHNHNENIDNDFGNVNAPNENEQFNGDPSEEESWEIGYYVSAMEALNQLAESGDLDSLWFAYARYGMEPKDGVTDVWGSDAAKEYYNLIKSLDAVDKWGGTAATEGTTGINWNRQEVLDSFLVVENVKLGEKYTVYDPVGNITNLEMNWSYQADGTLTGIRWDPDIGERYQHAFVFNPIEVDPLHLMMWEDESGATLVYDDSGKLTEVKINGYETKFLGKLTYGINGKVSTATVTDADGDNGTLTYSYNDQNQLVEVSFSSNGLTGNVYYTNDYWEGYGTRSWYGSDSFTYTYTYNADGTVATKTYSGYSQWYSGLVHSVVTEYSYDTAGNLSGAVCERKYNLQSDQSDVRPCTIKDTYTFVCDAQGNPVSVTINCGDALYESYTENSESPKIEIECVYGDLYSYNPVS